MIDHDELMKELGELEVSEVTIKISARRSVRAIGPAGDEFRTAESEETWKVVHPQKTISPDLAYAAAMKFTPLLFKKVMFDLVVAGVIKEEDAKRRLDYAKAAYNKALGVNIGPSAEQTKDQPDLRGAGDSISTVGKEPTEGSGIHQGEDHRMPTEAGPSDGPSPGSAEAASGGENSRP